MKILNLKSSILNRNGFSLIELLTVVAIIGILTSMIVVSTRSAQAKGRDAARKADLQEVSAALEAYRIVERQYPNVTTASGSWTTLKGFLFPIYIQEWPEDPNIQGAGRQYTYVSNSESLAAAGSMYVVDGVLETDDAITNPGVEESDNGDANFFLKGTYRGSDNKIHYRVSGR